MNSIERSPQTPTQFQLFESRGWTSEKNFSGTFSIARSATESQNQLSQTPLLDQEGRDRGPTERMRSKYLENTTPAGTKSA